MTAVGALYAGGAGVGLKSFAAAVEAAGLASVWCGDHVAGGVDGIAGLGVLAGATEAITIGSAVIVAPFRPAAVTAKGLMTAAHAAPGRTIVGLGAGGDLPDEFAAVGVRMEARGAFLDESIEVIQRLWSGRPVDFEGRWTTFTGMEQHPVLKSPPPIWVGGRSAAAVRRAVRVGDGYLPYMVSPPEVHSRVRDLHAIGSEFGRPWRGQVGAVVFVVPGPHRDIALATAVAAVPIRDLVPEQLGSRCLLGSADDILEQAGSFFDAGVDHLILGCPPGDRAAVDEFLAIGRRIVDELCGDRL